MPIDMLAYVYTPSRTSDGAGGWTFSVSDPARVFLAVTYHLTNTIVNIRQGAHSVAVGDILDIEGEYYRVTDLLKTNVANYYQARVEKTSKPVGL
jgi:hypothetical protein